MTVLLYSISSHGQSCPAILDTLFHGSGLQGPGAWVGVLALSPGCSVVDVSVGKLILAQKRSMSISRLQLRAVTGIEYLDLGAQDCIPDLTALHLGCRPGQRGQVGD
jgi:hypothetical protein